MSHCLTIYNPTEGTQCSVAWSDIFNGQFKIPKRDLIVNSVIDQTRQYTSCWHLLNYYLINLFCTQKGNLKIKKEMQPSKMIKKDMESNELSYVSIDIFPPSNNRVLMWISSLGIIPFYNSMRGSFSFVPPSLDKLCRLSVTLYFRLGLGHWFYYDWNQITILGETKEGQALKSQTSAHGYCDRSARRIYGSPRPHVWHRGHRPSWPEDGPQ